MNERGSATLWVLGLTLMVFALGGLSVDLWRGIAVRRTVAGIADAAAVAAANGIDERAWRSGQLVLDEPTSRALAGRVIAAEPGAAELVWSVTVSGDRATVTVRRDVPLTLLRLFDPGGEPLRVQVAATAVAVRSP